MRLPTPLLLFTALLPLLTTAFTPPIRREGHILKDANSATVKIAGTNWPGHNDAMIPEGLQYLPISSIVSKIRSLGLTSIRLTFAIEMIDDISNGGDISIEESFRRALGNNGAAVVQKIYNQNPGLRGKTRLQVFDAVAEECQKQGLNIVLDNHVSKAGWCCGDSDGNGWFGDTHFHVENWKRGLAYIANHVGTSRRS